MASTQNLSDVHEDLFKRFSNCVVSNHFQVAERILFLINNDQVQKMITENKEVVLEILMRGLLKSSKSHWNQTVQSMSANVMKSLMEVDQTLFEALSDKLTKEAEDVIAQEKDVKIQWDLLENEFS
mmetsp:Transcript_1213/g.1097  ORF Transcript_1213/g.1097 Transcript_1213/m.1097 type:complete len:126 (-) Transcript_1213:38-415(-)